MGYTFGWVLQDADMNDAGTRPRAALRDRGFGVLTGIDVCATLKKKIGVDRPGCKILGACNLRLAYEAIQLEPRVGAMQPRNVIVRAGAGGARAR